jgi:type VII secretion-associated serine protease mycosin
MRRFFHVSLALLCLATATTLDIKPAQAQGIQEKQWHLNYLKVNEAHRISLGSGVTVAVIDSGVEAHPDLRRSLIAGIDLASPGNGNGQQDTQGHGTRMAGLIAASGSSNGALGIAPESRILPIRINLQDESVNDPSTLAAGIYWAIKQKSQVINLSLGGGTAADDNRAIEAAIDADIVVVAAAGNVDQGDFGVTFPAAHEGVVAVGGTDKTGQHGSFSVSGKELTITAPGSDIVSTSIKGGYSSGTGTSDSAAIVSGAVALIRSKYPQLSAKEVIHRLTATATDKGAPGFDRDYGYGELNLVAALTADVPSLEPSPTPASTQTNSTPVETKAYSKKRSDNFLATAIVVSLAAILSIALVIAFIVMRIRDTQKASNKL